MHILFVRQGFGANNALFVVGAMIEDKEREQKRLK